ncbi:MAG: sugar ABC transporter substrate-binding protein [Chloroflexia bacterium]|nr:sugar ABC transporter substrate-binding protein [Chloroflexia bacterium]
MSANQPKQEATRRLSSRPSRRDLIKAGAASLAVPAAGTLLGGSAQARPQSSFGAPAIMRQASVNLQVTVWVGEPEFQAMQELAARYTESHPGVTVEFINIVDGGPWGRDQLQRMIAGGTPPDLMMMNTGQFEAFGSRDALANLDERIAADQLDLGVYWPAAVEGCKVGGAVHGLPKDISAHLVYLNTDFFADAGVELPSPEWTWDQYREVCKALVGQDKWGTSIEPAAWSWGSFIHTNGGQILSDDRTECRLTMPESTEALQAYFSVLTEDQSAVPPGALPQTPGGRDQWLAGIIGITMAGPWFRPTVVEADAFKWTVVPYPRPAGGEAPLSVLYTDQWAMSATSDNPDEAWELLKFLGGPDGLTAWGEIYGSRSITPVRELALSDAWLGFGGAEHRPDNQAFLDQLERTVPPPTNFANGAEVENLWNEQFELVIVSQQSVEQAAQIACEAITPVIGQQPSGDPP